MAMWPRSPTPMTTAVVPGVKQRRGLLTAWSAVSPASASAATSAGCSDGSSLTQTHAGLEQLGHAAVGVDAGEASLVAVHVVGEAAGPAQPTGDQRGQDHGVARGQVGDPGADLVDPAGVSWPRV